MQAPRPNSRIARKGASDRLSPPCPLHHPERRIVAGPGGCHQTGKAAPNAIALSAVVLAALAAALPVVAGAAALSFISAMPTRASEVLVATRTLRAATPITEADVTLIAGRVPPGAATTRKQVLGKEARVTLYAGRPIPLASLAPAALIERNQIVQLVFRHGGLDIRAEGRALGRAGEGERVRVMNLASRNTVTGRAKAAGVVAVAP